MTSHELAAANRAKDAAENDAKMTRHQREAEALDATTCAGCGRRWFTNPLTGRAVLPTWRSEAGAPYHTACWHQYELERR